MKNAELNELLCWHLKNIRQINKMLQGSLTDGDRIILNKVKSVYIRNYYFLQRSSYECLDLLE